MRKHKQLFWKFYLFLSLFSGLVLFFACDREDVDGSFPSNFKQPVVMDVKGYQIPTDSLPVISAFQFKPKRVALKAPRVMRAHKNVTLLPEHIPSVPVDTSTLQVITFAAAYLAKFERISSSMLSRSVTTTTGP